MTRTASSTWFSIPKILIPVILLLGTLAGSGVLSRPASGVVVTNSSVRSVQLTDTRYGNCFFPISWSGNPAFGDLRTWGDNTAWSSCGYPGTAAFRMGQNFTYTQINATTGLPQEYFESLGQAGLPVFSSSHYWYYRGEVVGTNSDFTGGSLSGFDTSGSNTQTGNKYSIDFPELPPFRVSPTPVVPATSNLGVLNSAPEIYEAADFPFNRMDLNNGGLGTHPSLSGSSAVVSLVYEEQIPVQVIKDSFGMTVETYPAQYSVDIDKFSNGGWSHYRPAFGQIPADYSTEQLQCQGVDSRGNAFTYSYQALVQTEAPLALVSGGYTGFAYIMADLSTTQTPCELPSHYEEMQHLIVADVNAIGSAKDEADFLPPGTATVNLPAGVDTCDSAGSNATCFDGFSGMWGNLLVYSTTVGQVGFAAPTEWLLDGSRSCCNNHFRIRAPQPTFVSSSFVGLSGAFVSNSFGGKTTDGSSMIWATGAPGRNTSSSIFVWNGHLGTREVVQNLTSIEGSSTGFPREWVDGRWAAWLNASSNFNGAAHFTFYDLYNATQAYLLHPRLYTVSASNPFLSDFEDGLAVWVSGNFIGGQYGFVLNWYNVTAASEGHPVSGNATLGFVGGTQTSSLGDMVVTNGWVYLSAIPAGGNAYQIFAVELPSTIVAVESGGSGVAQFSLSGNVSSSQVTQATYTLDSSGKLSKLELAVTGASGTKGSMTVTIPKSYLAAGAVASVYINGAAATTQSYTQDSVNYYISFVVHFSADDVKILFSPGSATSTSSTGTSTQPQSSAQTSSVTTSTGSSTGGTGVPEYPVQLIALSLFVASIVTTYAVVRRRQVP